MGMQVASIAMGSVITAAVPQEKRAHIPGQPKTAEQIQNSLPGRERPRSAELQKTTADLEQISLAFNRRLKFEIDQESREVIIKVIDNETDKVIKVLPPEELQRLHSRLKETIGFLFDRMV